MAFLFPQKETLLRGALNTEKNRTKQSRGSKAWPHLQPPSLGTAVSWWGRDTWTCGGRDKIGYVQGSLESQRWCSELTNASLIPRDNVGALLSTPALPGEGSSASSQQRVPTSHLILHLNTEWVPSFLCPTGISVSTGSFNSLWSAPLPGCFPKAAAWGGQKPRDGGTPASGSGGEPLLNASMAFSFWHPWCSHFPPLPAPPHWMGK